MIQFAKSGPSPASETVNLMLSGHNPLGRLNYSSWDNDGFDYDGLDMILHHSGTVGPVRNRFVHGPNMDEPLVEYTGAAADASSRKFLHADERGSIVAAA